MTLTFKAFLIPTNRLKKGQFHLIVAKLFEIIRNMSELQKIAIGVKKNAFPYFKISAFCSLIDRMTDKIFIEYVLTYEKKVHRRTQICILISGRENQIFISLHFCLFWPVWQTYVENIYRIDALIWNECAQKKLDLYLN